MPMKEADKQQTLVDKLCEEHNIPRIPVEIYKDLGGNQGLFLPDQYKIQLLPGTTKRVVFHEFTHYMARLISVVPELEESLCNYSAQGLKKQYRKQ